MLSSVLFELTESCKKFILMLPIEQIGAWLAGGVDCTIVIFCVDDDDAPVLSVTVNVTV